MISGPEGPPGGEIGVLIKKFNTRILYFYKSIIALLGVGTSGSKIFKDLRCIFKENWVNSMNFRCKRIV